MKNKFLKNESEKQKYAFLDRDGTLIYEPPDDFQVDCLEKLFILPGVIRGLKKLRKNGYKLIMISNQDGLGTKSFPRTKFTLPQNRLLKIFKENGIEFEKIFICPHLPKNNCNCRKPKIGLVKRFLEENKINIKNSFICGDRDSDKKFAKNIGIKFYKTSTNGQFQVPRNNNVTM
ncbi:MAG: histidinol-phosphatase [Patescibacteria group bacterium]